MITFSISTMGIFCIVYSILHISSFLNATVDTFCCDLQVLQDLQHVPSTGDQKSAAASEAISEAFDRWNEISAILRSASSAVSSSVLALQVVSISTLCLGIADVAWGALRGAPASDLVTAFSSNALVCAAISVMLFYACSVTDRCLQVPPLVNSMSFGEGTDKATQNLLVNFVSNSKAGFYVHDCQLRTSLVLKLHHLYAVGLFAAIFTILPNLCTVRSLQ